MVMSWGIGLPEELLFLVRENREDWALRGHSLSSSSSSSLLIIQPPLSSSSLSLHFTYHPTPPPLPCSTSILTSLVVETHSSSIPSYFHLFVSLSVRIQWTKLSPEERRLPRRRMDGLRSLQWGWAGDRVTKVTGKYIHFPSSISIAILLSLLFMCLSFQFTGWLDFITSTIICALTVFDMEKERQRRTERGSSYIIFLNGVHISKLCHHLTR